MTRGRFTAEDIVAIRASTEKGCELAKRYGVTDAMISQIRNYARYGYVQDDGSWMHRYGSRLNDKQVRFIRRSTDATSVLAERFSLSPQMINAIRRGACYAWVEAE